jgi:pyrroloquinoline quinone (PQQ) biosynthesis protein C
VRRLKVGDQTISSTSPEQALPRATKKNRKFTPDPPWVQEMDHFLAPYKQAIWDSQLVQETASGGLSIEQVKGWSIQFYPFIELFPQFMAAYLAKATDALSRGFLIDNLRVEKRHADQWVDMAGGFGVSKEELFSTPIIPQVEALTHWMWSITSRGSFVEAVAATNYAIEGVTQGIATIMVKGFMKYHGQDGVFLDKRAYMWMEAHAKYDDLHPYQALEIMKVHAPTVELQQKVTHAAQRSLEYLFLALEACYVAYGSAARESESERIHVM